MCTNTILECLPNDIKGILTRTYEKQISLEEWQRHDSSWDVLLTEDVRQNFIDLLRVLSKKEPFSVADCGVVSWSATSTTENKVEGSYSRTNQISRSQISRS